ncbi:MULTISPECIES: pyruvate dehydrogenase (acetyl-transferring) E1 component subunit alpha [unclassified Modestobacter]|uniref:pyruvate dehydrogenase (acetyl-transferring) E1 component subunit alpha n=1 Tax=unclassified Modestobacter TaxID=2643866 RepID=UPI0022AB2484|nr:MULTISPECIES: pyruvate dehydrogenase (acetyl-transferring) E1 component subunit alpha [unclassified Modestobacter]MCZ2826298.1 pyruvate dehydrogenase (acetyl-transferring) E1 component subunit alpha [Modestobacter sp. VKM Ac-2981]MCZ2852637.1 pyruvate dehydrogenase (acetyl-transferring) E1 component subunit alpha [Modestobacter sp. VKM Ac-2982]
MTRDLDLLLPSPHPVELIDPTGQTVAEATRELPDDAALLRAFAGLTTARRINDQASALARQGRLAVYPSSHGQEACQVAAAQVLTDDDWLFPTYRDTAAVVMRGVDVAEAFLPLQGAWHSGYDPHEHKTAPQATPLATQLLHAVGVAHAARLRGEPTVALALCGDGATSEGDFHEALNFAAVFRAPVVFLVQNNQYAISVPLARQSVAPSLAHKGIGYGVPGERVDGNDVAALLAVLGTAMARARAGEGPQLVEAHTYRMQPHTNADDSRRYRKDDEVAGWAERDPLARLETWLRQHDLLDDARLAAVTADADQLAARMRTELAGDATPEPAELFAHVYATPTPQLVEQAAVVADELSREDAHR